MDKLVNRIAALGTKVEVEASARQFLATKGYDPQFGARPLKRAVQNYLEDELSELLIEQSPSPTSVVVVTAPEGAEKLKLEVKDVNEENQV